jgi:hypothetical protein
MAGALIQLVAYGAQDVYLTAEPTMSFWKATYRRHSNFAMESMNIPLTGSQNFGSNLNSKISRNGDLIGRTYLNVNVDGISTGSGYNGNWVSYGTALEGNDFSITTSENAQDDSYKIIGGNSIGDITFNDGPQLLNPSGKERMIISKIDNLGNWIWRIQVSSTIFLLCNSLTILNDNSIIIGGLFRGDVIFGGTTITANVYNSGFLAKLTSDGLTWDWVIKLDGNLINSVNNIVHLNNENSTIVCGYFSGTITFGATTLTSFGSLDIFIAKINNTNGNWIWATQIGNEDLEIPSYIIIAPDDSIIMSGGFYSSSITFPDISVTMNNEGTINSFVAKLDSDGTFLWAKQIGGDNESVPPQIGLLSNNDIILGGIFQASLITFPGIIDTISSPTLLSYYILKIDFNGNWIWAKEIIPPDGLMDNVFYYGFSDINILNDDSIIISGTFKSSYLTFGTNTIYNNTFTSNNHHIFIAKMNTNTQWDWAVAYQGNQLDYLNHSIISNDNSKLYLIGSTTSNNLPFGNLNLTTQNNYTNSFIVELDLNDLVVGNLNRIGFKLLKSVELRIGGQQIDCHYSNWMYIWSELSHNTDMKQLLDKMLNSSNLTIPLFFSYCRNPGLALPLIALQYHEIELNFKLIEKIDEFQSASILNMNLWVDYIFLDTEERKEFAQKPHEYLIEITQSQEQSIPSNAKSSTQLYFNHPTKFIAWAVKTSEQKNFDYTNNNNSCIVNGKIKLNGQDRFETRDNDYFNYIVPYQHFNIYPVLGINVYSFALKPLEHQPSGTCNFSRIDNINLELTTYAEGTKLYVYAFSYNVLRIASGMGGLAFSN